VVWTLPFVLVLGFPGAVLFLRHRRRLRGWHAAGPVIPVVPTPGPVPSSVRVRVGEGESHRAPEPERVTTGGRVRMRMHVADPRPKERNAGQQPFGGAKLVVRTVDAAPRLTEMSGTVAAGRVRAGVTGGEPEFWPGDGESVILKRS
jgi:hypothetical protein